LVDVKERERFMPHRCRVPGVTVDHNEQLKGLKHGGNLFARPDNFVAWRARSASKRRGDDRN
jgi:hypothetical protein